MVSSKALSNRQLRVLWVGAFVVAGLYIWIAEASKRTFEGHITIWHWAIAALAAYSAFGGHVVRRKLIAQAIGEAISGKELAASKKWSAAQIVALMSAQAVVLGGVLAKLVSCPRAFAAPFYLGGIVLLICYRPGKQPVPTHPRSN